MKYIRKFSTPEDREAYLASTPAPDMPYIHLVASTGEVKFSSPEVDYPLYIKAIENLTVRFANTYEYSKDNAEWTNATSSTSISVTKGERVFFRASGLTADSPSGIGSFNILYGDCYVGGNVMSMVYGADFKGKMEITQTKQFYRLFYNSGSSDRMRIIDASGLALPATTLASNCYAYMFYGCTSLVNAPALPATTLASNCYDSMFQRCASLVNAPALPATTLASNCYDNMFRGCTSLVNAPALPATTLASNCYDNMFYGCTSLTTAPELPATTLIGYCYYNMFNGCTKLNYIKAMFKTTPSSFYTTNWVAGVASSGTFVKNKDATWDVTGADGVPEGWTVILE